MAEHQKYMHTYTAHDCMEEVEPETLKQHRAAGGKERVLVVHDEMVMGSFEAPGRQWQGRGAQTLPRKSLGPTAMVSEFLSERIGPIKVTPEQWEQVPDDVAIDLIRWYRKLNGSDDFAKSDDVRTRAIILPGKSREGYWTGEHVVMQTKHLAIPLFELTHPDCEGVFVFDNSSCHGLYAPDALVASRLNANPGGQQPKMREGWFMRDGERVKQSMVFECDRPDRPLARNFSLTDKDGKKWSYKKGEVVTDADERLKKLIGLPKGGFQVRCCRVRGLYVNNETYENPISHYTRSWLSGASTLAVSTGSARAPRRPTTATAAWLKRRRGLRGRAAGTRPPNDPRHGKCCGLAILTSHPDFVEQRPWLEEVVENAGHHCVFLPKFHPELNFIERYWACIKHWLRYHCDEGGNTMRLRMRKAMNDPKVAPLSLIRKHARVSWRYMDAYRKGLTGALADYAVKKAKSHRTVSTVVDKAVMDMSEQEQMELERAAGTMVRERLDQMNNPGLVQIDAAAEEAG